MDYELPDLNLDIEPKYKLCEYCSKQFDLILPNKIFCSRRCKEQSKHRRREKAKAVALRESGITKQIVRKKKRSYTKPTLDSIHDKKKLRTRNRYFKGAFGISAKEADELKANHSRCDICGTDDPGGRDGTWHIDHKHGVKAVRGLLCYKCNNGLGCFNDNIISLHNAIKYLERNTF